MPVGSKGPAVVMLQLLLLAMEYNQNIVPDGNYGEQTEIGVTQLQAVLGVDQDGQFGPETRKALLRIQGIDVNSLKSESFQGETTVPENQG